MKPNILFLKSIKEYIDTSRLYRVTAFKQTGDDPTSLYFSFYLRDSSTPIAISSTKDLAKATLLLEDYNNVIKAFTGDSFDEE